MKHTLLHRFAVYFVAASIFFSAVTVTSANELTFPQQLMYPGLTFADPLTSNHPLPTSQPAPKITFTSQNKLTIQKNISKKKLPEALTPTGSAPTASDVIFMQPTPTIYIRNMAQTPTPTPTTTPQPTQQSTTPTTPVSSPTIQTNTGGLNPATLFSMVNSYRQTNGLPVLQQDTKTCTLASERAPQIAEEIAAGTMHSGLKALNLPYWNTENIISMNSEQAAFNWWINDPIHHAAIVGNYTYSCVACSGNSCAEEFTNYQPK